MNRSITRGLCVCLSAVALASCQDYDGGFSESQIKEAAYAKNFVKAFGEIDPNQNWDLFGQMAQLDGVRANTRAAADIVVTDLDESYYKNITSEMNSQYQKMLPESEDRPRPYANTNLGRVTQNFSAYATTLTLYPIHWNTSGSDVIGIYYYTNASDPEKTTITGADGKTYYVVQKQVYENKTHVDLHYPERGIEALTYAQDLSIVFDWGVDYFRSKPIQVTIPANVGKIGFYITNGTNPTKYSESKLNSIYNFSDVGEKEECFVATYIDTDASGDPITEDGKPVRYLCFEDWTGTSNFDMNDVVFRVYGLDEGGSKIVDEDEYDETAILVCEDLGDHDFDYNDIVLKLNYRESQTKEYTRDSQGNVTNVTLGTLQKTFSITAMAAGGANESDVYYGTTKWNEIHKLLGGNAPSIINAGPTMGAEGQTVTLTGINVPNYSRTSTDKFLSLAFLDGYIAIKTYSKGANTTSDDAGILITSEAYKTKGAPQMILLPADYLWCREGEGIEGVYPGFTQWVSDATLTNWLSSRSSGNGLFTNRVVPVVSENVPTPTTPPSHDPEAVTYTITASVAAECSDMGTVSGAGTYDENSEITLVATPNDGYEFVKWVVGSEELTDNSIDVTVSGNATYTAYFRASAISCSITTISESESIWGYTTNNYKIALPDGDLTGKKLVITLNTTENADILSNGIAGVGTIKTGGSTGLFEISDFSPYTDGYVYVTCYTSTNSIKSAEIK